MEQQLQEKKAELQRLVDRKTFIDNHVRELKSKLETKPLKDEQG